MTDEIKKSYNPFKMWGSYVVGFFVSIYLGLVGFADAIRQNIFGKLFPSLSYSFGELCGFLILFIFGFLLGWVIHSIFRKIKSK